MKSILPWMKPFLKAFKDGADDAHDDPGTSNASASTPCPGEGSEASDAVTHSSTLGGENREDKAVPPQYRKANVQMVPECVTASLSSYPPGAEDGGDAEPLGEPAANAGRVSAWKLPSDGVSADVVDVLASWPDCHTDWWKDEGFSLKAAALGYHHPATALRTAVSQDRELAHWEAIAKRILDRNFDENPSDRSTIDSWLIGLRRFPRSEVCMKAMAKLQSVRPVKWRRIDHRANKLLPR